LGDAVMKITDPDIIKNGEKLLIESLTNDLNLETVREIIKDKLSVSSISPKGGKLVVHNNQIAFRMDFGLLLSGSLIFDRQGNYIPDSGMIAKSDSEIDVPLESSEPDDSSENTDNKLTQDETANDDITNILKESREYWEKIKGS
jgi:hypothetical protein